MSSKRRNYPYETTSPRVHRGCRPPPGCGSRVGGGGRSVGAGCGPVGRQPADGGIVRYLDPELALEHERVGSNRESWGRRRGGSDERIVGGIGGRQRQQHEPAGRPAGRSAGRGCGEPVSDKRPDGQLDGHLDAGSSAEHEHLGPHHEPWRRWLRDADQRLVGQVGRGQQEQHDPVDRPVGRRGPDRAAGRRQQAVGGLLRELHAGPSEQRQHPRADLQRRGQRLGQAGQRLVGQVGGGQQERDEPERGAGLRVGFGSGAQRLRRRVWRPRRSGRPGRRAVRLQRPVGAFVGHVGAGPSEQRQHPGAHRLVGR